MLYFSYTHSIISFGVLFWVNSSDSIKVLRIQKKIIRIITNLRKRDSYRNIFQIMNIPPFYSQYIFSCLIYITKTTNAYV